MRPVRTEDATVVYKAPPTMPECGDLYVHRVRPGVIRSTWEPNDQEREILAAGGRIQLTLAHEPIPPIMLEVMAKEVTEPVGDHPWRVDKDPKLSPPKESRNGKSQFPKAEAERTAQEETDSKTSREETDSGDA